MPRPRVGKTALLDIVVARGQCVEQFGAAESDVPVLEALGALRRGDPALVPLAHVQRRLEGYAHPCYVPLTPMQRSRSLPVRAEVPTTNTKNTKVADS